MLKSGMSSGCAKRVLIVDDNRDAADLLAILVRVAGHNTLVAYDSLTGLALAREQTPDIIIHDIGMPIQSGYDIAKLLRADSRFDETLLVALSAYSTRQDRELSRASGFDLHLAKPLDHEELKRVLELERSCLGQPARP